MPICPTPTGVCARIRLWDCAASYNSCQLVSYDGWIYGTLEAIEGPSTTPITADERYTKGMMLDDAIKWIHACAANSDTYDSITTNPNGSFHVQRIDADGNVIEEYDIGGTPIYSDSDMTVTDNGDGTVTFQRLVDGVPVGDPIIVDYNIGTVAGFGTLEEVNNGDGTATITFTPDDGGAPVSWTIEVPCDAAWMLPRRAASNRSKVDVAFNGDKAGAVATYDGSAALKLKEIGTATLTDADLKDLGKRPTDNTVVVDITSFAQYWSGASDPASDAELAVRALATWDHVATGIDMWAEATTNNKDDDRDSVSKLVDFAIPDGSDLNVTLNAALMQESGAQATEDMLSDNFQAQWKVIVEVVRFYHSDDGTAEVIGGCLKK